MRPHGLLDNPTLDWTGATTVLVIRTLVVGPGQSMSIRYPAMAIFECDESADRQLTLLSSASRTGKTRSDTVKWNPGNARGEYVRAIRSSLICLALCAPTARALAGISITYFHSTVEVNGYAPVGQTEYFDQQRLTNISPVSTQVFDDWWGPNSGGSINTWHYVGSAQIRSTTTFDSNSLAVTGAGAFAYTVDTAADWIEPALSSTYSPGAAADYDCEFTLDTPATYTAHIELTGWSHVQLSSFDTGHVFNLFHHASDAPLVFDRAGSLAPGRYYINANTSFGTGNFLPPFGVHHDSRSGGYDNYTFSLQVPEPSLAGAGLLVIIGLFHRHQRDVVAG